MGIIRSFLNADTDEVTIIRSALDAKSTSEPVLREQRSQLSKPVPTWAAKLSSETVLTEEHLAELEESLAARRALFDGYPDGPKRTIALARHQQAQETVARLRDTLTIGTRGDHDPGDDLGEHNGHHHGEHGADLDALAAG
ncbi:MAG: hypothetical protein INR66_06735 [Gordonia polyisoprenivorans]|nr:hypothetical protein [Gordonia polyisoprenivorans]